MRDLTKPIMALYNVTMATRMKDEDAAVSHTGLKCFVSIAIHANGNWGAGGVSRPANLYLL